MEAAEISAFAHTDQTVAVLADRNRCVKRKLDELTEDALIGVPVKSGRGTAQRNSCLGIL